MSRRRATCSPPSRRRCPPTFSSPPRRSRIGASKTSGAQKIKKTAQRPADSETGRKPGHSRDHWPKFGRSRPTLVVGFAAETQNVLRERARQIAAQRMRFDCRQRGRRRAGTFRRYRNQVHIVTRDGVESWPRMSKQEVAARFDQRDLRDVGQLKMIDGAKSSGFLHAEDFRCPLTIVKCCGHGSCAPR